MKKKSPRDGVKVKFRDWDCQIKESKYQHGNRPALLLVDPQTGHQIACATVNLPEIPLKQGEVLIKDYSENEGMLRALEDAGVVRATGESVPSGYVWIPKCELLVPERQKETTRQKNPPERRSEPDLELGW